MFPHTPTEAHSRARTAHHTPASPGGLHYEETAPDPTGIERSGSPSSTCSAERRTSRSTSPAQESSSRRRSASPPARILADTAAAVASVVGPGADAGPPQQPPPLSLPDIDLYMPAAASAAPTVPPGAGAGQPPQPLPASLSRSNLHLLADAAASAAPTVPPGAGAGQPPQPLPLPPTITTNPMPGGPAVPSAVDPNTAGTDAEADADVEDVYPYPEGYPPGPSGTRHDGRWECFHPECSLDFKNRPTWQAHVKLHWAKPFKCLCKREYDEIRGYRAHVDLKLPGCTKRPE